MKIETMGRVLIVIGALLVLYALLVMPVARPGADLVNIHLISERQNTLILGGLLFFAGIMLFSVFKLKQTKEEGEQEAALQRERVDRAKALAVAVLQKPSESAVIARKKVIESMDGGALSTVIRFAIGLVAGGFFGVQIATIAARLVERFTNNFIELWGFYSLVGAAMLICIAYAFRKIEITRIFVHFIFAFPVLTAVAVLI